MNLDKQISQTREIEIENENYKKSSGNNENTIEIPKIDLDDIHDEIDYWKNSIVYYNLGASPPQDGMEDFFQRIWVNMAIDRIVIVGNGIYMVRLCNQEDQQKILVEE